MKRSRGSPQEEYRDVYLRNLNLLNNQMVADAAFDMIEVANRLREIRVNPKKPLFDKNTNLWSPVLEHKFGYLFYISRAEVERNRLDANEKKILEDSKRLLKQPYGTYDTTELLETAFGYYDILLRQKIIAITHGREEETLSAKLDKW